MHNAYTSHMCVCVNFYKIYEFGLENSKKYEELYVTVVAFYHVLLFSNLLTFCFQKKRKREGKIRKIIYWIKLNKIHLFDDFIAPTPGDFIQKILILSHVKVKWAENKQTGKQINWISTLECNTFFHPNAFFPYTWCDKVCESLLCVCYLLYQRSHPFYLYKHFLYLTPYSRNYSNINRIWLRQQSYGSGLINHVTPSKFICETLRVKR